MSVLRDTLYRCQELAQEGNIVTLINQYKRVPNAKNRIDQAVGQSVIDHAIEFPVRSSGEPVMSFAAKVYLIR